MLPLVVIAGRPNVGKSTLFNRLAGRRMALVADTPGVTRDRKEAEALLRGRRVRLVDTGGLEEAAPETLAGRMRSGAAVATEAADVVLFVVDARAGVTAADRHFAAWLRRQGRSVLVVANKAEGRSTQSSVLEAFELGLGEPVAVSAEHGEGISDLMAEIADRLPADDAAAVDVVEPAGEAGARPLKLAIVGRPNVGKSTLLNRLVGEDRMLTGPEPGLTRDAVAVLLDNSGGAVELVDTAGLRRRARIEAPLEKLAVGAAIGALKLAEVVVLVVDAVDGLHDQDLQIAQLIEREGRACVLALNKWDAVADRAATRRAIAERLEFEPGADARHSGGRVLGADRGGSGPAAARGAPSPRGVEHAAAHGGAEPLVRAGAGPPSAAAGERAAAQAALCHAGEGKAADLCGVRDPGGAAPRGLPAVSGEQPARGVRLSGDADQGAVTGNAKPVCRGVDWRSQGRQLNSRRDAGRDWHDAFLRLAVTR